MHYLWAFLVVCYVLFCVCIVFVNVLLYCACHICMNKKKSKLHVEHITQHSITQPNLYPENLPFLRHAWSRATFPTSSETENAHKQTQQSMKFFSGMRNVLGVNENTAESIEQNYLDVLQILENHFKVNG